MTPLRTINLLRGLFITFCLCLGLMMGEVVFGSMALGAALGALVGLAVVLLDRLLHGIALRIFSSATFGLLLGVIFAQLLLASNVLKYMSEQAQWLTSLVIYAVFGYLGMMLAIRSNRDEFALIIPYVRFRRSAVQDLPLLVDTNIIIDGRVAAVCATGFLSGSLVVPRFVLDELQRLADSAEPEKRQRGKRGLDTMSEIKATPNLSVTIHETEHDASTPVDTRLLDLARLLQARLLTNDANLCKIARLQNIAALNLNELTHALRQNIGAADTLEVTLSKEGRESHQAVGYLPDGTMIVVNKARPHLGETRPVRITTSLQTSAGRMYFAELE